MQSEALRQLILVLLILQRLRSPLRPDLDTWGMNFDLSSATDLSLAKFLQVEKSTIAYLVNAFPMVHVSA